MNENEAVMTKKKKFKKLSHLDKIKFFNILHDLVFEKNT